MKFWCTHRDLGLLDLPDLPLGRRNRAGGLRGETGGIVKTLLSVEAGFHHHLPLTYSGKASHSPLSLSLSHCLSLHARKLPSVSQATTEWVEWSCAACVVVRGGWGRRSGVGGGVGGSVTKSSLRLSCCHTSFKVWRLRGDGCCLSGGLHHPPHPHTSTPHPCREREGGGEKDQWRGIKESKKRRWRKGDLFTWSPPHLPPQRGW